jgi:hypothetical protein
VPPSKKHSFTSLPLGLTVAFSVTALPLTSLAACVTTVGAVGATAPGDLYAAGEGCCCGSVSAMPSIAGWSGCSHRCRSASILTAGRAVRSSPRP